MAKRSAILGCVAIAALTAFADASLAQDAVGSVIANAIARRQSEQEQRDCVAQAGAAIGTWRRESVKLEFLMSRVLVEGFSSTPATVKPRESSNAIRPAPLVPIQKLFVPLRGRGLRTLDGKVIAPRDIRPASSSPTTLVAVAFTSDGTGARGLWSQVTDDQATPELFYTADFSGWMGDWKLVRILTSATEPTLPFKRGDYCLGVEMPPPLW